MTTIKSTSYNIHIGDKSLTALTAFFKKGKYSKTIIICDENTIIHCLPKLIISCPELADSEIIELESGEEHKTIETCIQVWGAFTDIGIDKKSLVINLGGGVITDLGGFVASTYKRGVDFINIPTTLLSMADASVGGKTGIDFNGIKNHIGTFSVPKGIFINPVFLQTLPARHINNGFAEIIKIAIVTDIRFWNKLKKIKTHQAFCNEDVIVKAIDLKNTVVKKDLKEKNSRKKLNFGHTIGHAIESAFINSKKDILHGEAIVAGMIIELEIALVQKTINKKQYSEVVNYLTIIYKKIKLNSVLIKQIIELIKHDKKNIGDNIYFSLPKGIGDYELNSSVNEDAILKALKSY